MHSWEDIKVGETYRFRNNSGQELDRTIVSVDKKKVVFQRTEVEVGKLSDIGPERFIKYHNTNGICLTVRTSID
jgi:hypothetical protein